jgi:hypothetical protein
MIMCGFTTAERPFLHVGVAPVDTAVASGRCGQSEHSLQSLFAQSHFAAKSRLAHEGWQFTQGVGGGVGAAVGQMLHSLQLLDHPHFTSHVLGLFGHQDRQFAVSSSGAGVVESSDSTLDSHTEHSLHLPQLHFSSHALGLLAQRD